MTPGEVDRDMLERLLSAAKAYREAFERVEAAIAFENNKDMPTWVFNYDGMELDKLARTSPTVAHAERHRRAARAALHAVAELLAFDDPGRSLTGSEFMPPDVNSATDMSNWAGSLTARQGDDLYWLRVLDRFVGIVNRADANGALYVNGTFEPLLLHEEEDSADITQITDTRRGGD